jgi:hypothetical protein
MLMMITGDHVKSLQTNKLLVQNIGQARPKAAGSKAVSGNTKSDRRGGF